METMNLRKRSINSFFVVCEHIHAIAVFHLIIIMGLVSINTKAQEWTDITTRFIKNAGFDEDLTIQSDGTMKEAFITGYSLSCSWAYITADSTVYAHPKSDSGHNRPDGRTEEALFGCIGHIQGWTVETNREFPSCEWAFFGSLPYNLVDTIVPIMDGTDFLNVPNKPESNNDNNVACLYLRAGWGSSCIYKQEIILPAGNYRLEYKTININPNNTEGKALCKVIGSNGYSYEDETDFSNTQWTQHCIHFSANGTTTIQVGLESAISASSHNLILAIDDIKLYTDIVDINIIDEIKENVFTYSGESPNLSFSNTNTVFKIVDYDSSTLQINAGSYTSDIIFYVKYLCNDVTFEVKEPFSYTINKAPLHVRAYDISREYGEENPPLSLVYSGFVNNEDQNVLKEVPSAITAATRTSNVGEYPISVSGGAATNYELFYEPGVLTVTRAHLSAIVNDTTKVYGSLNPSFTIDYYGLKNEETVPEWTTKPTFQTAATPKSVVGKYEVIAVNGVPVNYDLEEVISGTLSIIPAPLTIKVNDATRQYYSDNPSFSYSCIGFVNDEDKNVLLSTPTISTSANLKSNVGTYEIKAYGADTPNYSITYISGTLSITPITLMASVGNYERLYNEDNPAFDVKYDGFVDNENENVLITKATASTTATKTSDVGSYPINVNSGSADNYNFSYTSGTLTINKVEQSISWEQDLTALKVGDQVELKAVASSGLPITYSMDNSDAVEIYSTGSKTYLDCKAGGQFLIRAMQNGNKNYYASPKASNNVSIIGNQPTSAPLLTIKLADNGSVSTKVNKGSSHTFTIQVESGWKIHSVAFNDDDVTSQLDAQGKYTTPAINENSTLMVVYEKEEENAVSSARESSVKIQGTSFGVRVTDDNMDDMIMVYSADGIQQKSVKVEGLITDIPLSKDKVYIIKVGTKTVKLSL